MYGPCVVDLHVWAMCCRPTCMGHVLTQFLPLPRFTGQVGVASNESANQWQGMLNSMFSDFSEEYRENASDLLTTKQSKHYWTKCMPETSKDNVVQALGVTTKYHAFTNERYLGVTQDVASGEQGPWWTQCFR